MLQQITTIEHVHMRPRILQVALERHKNVCLKPATTSLEVVSFLGRLPTVTSASASR